MSAVPLPTPATVQVVGLAGIGEVRAGDDLAELLLAALTAAGTPLQDGDVVAVSSKVVSKAMGLTVPAADREGAVDRSTVRTVAARRTPSGLARIVEATAGPVMAAAGVDASNVADGTVLVLPPDPDAAARAVRDGLAAATGARVGVVVTDTAGRPWREGQVDFALGAAGLAVVDDLRGGLDSAGREMSVTSRVVVDEVAAAADLVKGKTDGVPAALVRGLGDWVTPEDGRGARSLVRAAAGDWFRFGHVEAVRASVGAAHVEPPSVVPATARGVLDRVAQVATAGGPGACLVHPTDDPTDHQGDDHGDDGPGHLLLTADDDFALGLLTQRTLAALWIEDLTAPVERTADGVVLRPVPAGG